jgi:ankyrin repeat protein
LKRSADVNAKSLYWNTALICAVKRGCSEKVRLLLDAGADVNVKDNFGDTPLSLAEERKYVDIVRMLKAAGAKE